MTTYFVSRHPGAIEWAARQKLNVTHFVAHLDTSLVQPGDSVLGTLPVNLAAQVCAKGARYWHLSVEVPATLRGQELSADELQRLDASLNAYHVELLKPAAAITG